MAVSNRVAKKIKKGLAGRVRTPEEEVAEIKKRMKKLPVLPHSKPKPATPKKWYR